jgi:hypothetical protein
MTSSASWASTMTSAILLMPKYQRESRMRSNWVLLLVRRRRGQLLITASITGRDRPDSPWLLGVGGHDAEVWVAADCDIGAYRP